MSIILPGFDSVALMKFEISLLATFGGGEGGHEGRQREQPDAIANMVADLI